MRMRGREEGVQGMPPNHLLCPLIVIWLLQALLPSPRRCLPRHSAIASPPIPPAVPPGRLPFIARTAPYPTLSALVIIHVSPSRIHVVCRLPPRPHAAPPVPRWPPAIPPCSR